MNNISGNRTGLCNLPPNCMGTIVNQLAVISDIEQPMHRSLLRWAGASKDMQAQLAVWTHRHAQAADYVVQAFKDALWSDVPFRRTLRTAEVFAKHLTADLLSEVIFLKADPGQVSFAGPDLALTLIALAHIREKLPQDTAVAFFQEVESHLFPEGTGRHAMTADSIDCLKAVARSIFSACGLINPKYQHKNARLSECFNTLLMLPQCMKSVAMHAALNSPAMLGNTAFEQRFVELLDQLVPRHWDPDFMQSDLGAMTLDACEEALQLWHSRPEKFLVAYSRLLGGFIAAMPVGHRHFRRICNESFIECHEPICPALVSNDPAENLLIDHKSAKEILRKILYLLNVGHASTSCRQAFLADFVDGGLLVKEEFDALMDLFSRGGHVRSFSELAAMLEDLGRNDKAGNRSRRKCVIS